MAILSVYPAMASDSPGAVKSSGENAALTGTKERIRSEARPRLALAVSSAEGEPAEEEIKSSTIQSLLLRNREKLNQELRQYNIDLQIPPVELQLPDEIEELDKNCHTLINQADHWLTSFKVESMEFYKWMVQHLRQLTGMPTMTPMGSPYTGETRVMPPPPRPYSLGAELNSSRLHMTESGRLRRIVDR